MGAADVVVVGGGISGASFAFLAARAGRAVTVVEAAGEAGGALATARHPGGFWYELGAHTCYSSYGATLDLLSAAGLRGELLPRGKPVLRFLDQEGRLLRGSNLTALLLRFRKGELLRSLTRWPGALRAPPAGRTVRERFAPLVGERNYARVLGPLLSAVPSQPADEFPAELLFKRRPRREDVPRSFTLAGGLRRAAAGLLAATGVEVLLGRRATSVARQGAGFAVALDDGRRLEAGTVALAVPPRAAAKLLDGALPAAARAAAQVLEAEVESLGCALPAERTALPYASFLIPLGGDLYSVVTRDVVPDPNWRGFAFHFRPGLSREARMARAAEVLGVAPGELEAVAERRSALPSPRRGHAERVAQLDGALSGGQLAVTGNWFGGLAIEDCVLRSRSEWTRVSGL
jgi:UDP-galactopyranose mutase